MKNFKLFLIILISQFSFLMFAASAFAHELETDGSIGAVIHIDPEDDPIIGKQSSFYFEFKDKKNKFTPDHCECTFAIVEHGKERYSQPLFSNTTYPSLSNATVSYTFTKQDSYQIKVTGKPLSANAFQPFNLTWDIRVDRTDDTTISTQSAVQRWITTHMLVLVVVLGAVSIFSWILVRKMQQNKQQTIEKI